MRRGWLSAKFNRQTMFPTQDSFRPPFYGWFLDGWRDLTGSLNYLPLTRFLCMALGLLFFAIEFGRMVRNAPAGAVLVPMHPGI